MNHTELYSIFARDFSKQIMDFNVQPNPEELLQEAMEIVETALAFLSEHYETEYDDFRTYLQMAHPILHKKIDQLWDELDNDIFDHYAHGTLLSFELKAWKKSLHAWRDTFLQSIKEFVKEAFHEHIDPTMQKPKLVAA